MAVKTEPNQMSGEVFQQPPTDPYLVGIARFVDDGMAHTAPGWLCLTIFSQLSYIELFSNCILGSCVCELW